MIDNDKQAAVLGIGLSFDGGTALLQPDEPVRLQPTSVLSAGSGTRCEYDIAGTIALLTIDPVEPLQMADIAFLSAHDWVR